MVPCREMCNVKEGEECVIRRYYPDEFTLKVATAAAEALGMKLLVVI